MNTKHDLLSEPILSWRGRERTPTVATLPGVLAALSRGEVVDFPRARAHQQHPWSMFLTQLAAIALRRAGLEAPPVDDSQWRELLLALTSGEREPWCLVVDDLSKAAFFQPPVPEGELRKASKDKLKPGDEWSVCRTPDNLDVLVTAKKHDVKSGLIAADDAEAWVYALVSLQTTQGFPGRGYSQIARMNGGYGNRPRVGLSSGLFFGDRFARDVPLLLKTWAELVDRGFDDSGIALVWREPWNGETSLSVSELAPHFIEVCWRVRLTATGAALKAHYTTTAARRCAPEVDGGDVGDPWIPVSRKDGKALTPGSGGYHYKLVVELLFAGSYAPAPAQELLTSDGEEMLFWASALARGQGKTEGLHERVIAISGRARRAFAKREAREALAKRAEERVKRAAEMRSNVLFPALKLIALGETVPPDDLDARIDARFFDSLFATAASPDEEACSTWDDELAVLAEAELEKAIEGAALPDARYWKATTAARGMFFGCLKKRFPDTAARRLGARGETAAQPNQETLP